jgi:excisionase family DNA binding protein
MPRAIPGSPAVATVEKRRSGPRNATLPRFYTTQEISESLDVSPRTVSRWIASGDLIAHLGHSVRIVDDDLRVFLARRRGGIGRCRSSPYLSCLINCLENIGNTPYKQTFHLLYSSLPECPDPVSPCLSESTRGHPE